MIMDQEYLNIIQELGLRAREYAEDAINNFSESGIIDKNTSEDEIIADIEMIKSTDGTVEYLIDSMVLDMDVENTLLGSYRKEVEESMINGFKKAIRDFLK